MAGNKNSGRHGKDLPQLIQQACKRAIKQGNAGLAGQRALSDLLAETMQNDPLAFLRAVAPYVPKEIILDQSVSITVALEEARNRLIDLNTLTTEPLLLDQPQDDSTTITIESTPCAVPTSSQGGV